MSTGKTHHATETITVDQTPEDVPPSLTGIRRRLAVGLGLVLVGIGLLGVILPGLPSTIFLLGASYCFARSSPRLNRWLLHHPRLGPPLRTLQRDRTMSLKAKVISLAFMWAGVWVSSMVLTGNGPLIVVGLAVIGTAVILLGIKTGSPG
jgi:hypothetical protein